MNLFEKYDHDTWLRKDDGYPVIAISDPDTSENIYWGRCPQDYFKEFDIKFYQDCQVTIFTAPYSWLSLGSIGQLKNWLPKINVEITYEEVK